MSARILISTNLNVGGGESLGGGVGGGSVAGGKRGVGGVQPILLHDVVQGEQKPHSAWKLEQGGLADRGNRRCVSGRYWAG